MNNSAMVSDFVRDAIREKAGRELAALNQKTEAFAGASRISESLTAVASELAKNTAAMLAVTGDASLGTKLKKLRKMVDEAEALAKEVDAMLGDEATRETVRSARTAIIDELRSVGLDPEAIAA